MADYVDLKTVSGLNEAISNHGGLAGRIFFYDVKSGDTFKAVAVYPAGPPNDDVTVIDIEEMPTGGPD